MYSDQVEIRNRPIDGLTNWTCAKRDTSWNCIVRDWENHARDLVLGLCPPDKRRAVVQAGGHQGMYPRLLSRIFNMVYTFEPNPLNFYCLVQNCQADNVVKIQAALGAYCGTVRNIPNDRNTGMNMIDEYDETGHVPMLTLDSFSLKFLDLLYLDLEGHETKALKGAVSTILKHRPVVVLENADNEANDFLMNRCYEFVCQHHMDYFYVPK